MSATNDITDFYNDLGLSFDKAWSVIEPGISKRTSAAHTPVVATLDAAGIPQQRVMVLRAADRQQRRLRFHTDSRSAKIEQSGPASVLMYDPDEKVQLRFEGSASAQTNGDEVDAAWQASTTFARRCYMAKTAPGSLAAGATSGLPEWIEGKQPAEAQLEPYRPNFALLWFDIASVEFLYLANAGHRRAKWHWDEYAGTWSGRWLIP
jgi:pyridoxamine 5'-phosphate oxidase